MGFQSAAAEDAGGVAFSLNSSFRRFEQTLHNGPSENFALTSEQTHTAFCVPTAFIDSLATRGRDDSELHLQMRWPTLEPLPSDFSDRSSEAAYEKSEALRRTGIYFGVIFRQGRLARMKEIIRDHVLNDWTREASPTVDPLFIHYHETLLHERTPTQLRRTILIPRDSTLQDRMYLECPLHSDFEPSSVYCTGHTYLSHFVYAEYTFAVAHLGAFKAFDSAARGLFSLMTAHPDCSPLTKNLD